jgi:hypothetical protein
MHWKYEWVGDLPNDVYQELVAMLNEEAAARDVERES